MTILYKQNCHFNTVAMLSQFCLFFGIVFAISVAKVISCRDGINKIKLLFKHSSYIISVVNIMIKSSLCDVILKLRQKLCYNDNFSYSGMVTAVTDTSCARKHAFAVRKHWKGGKGETVPGSGISNSWENPCSMETEQDHSYHAFLIAILTTH